MPQLVGRLWWRAVGVAVLAAAGFAGWGLFAVGGGPSRGNGPLFMGSYGLDGGPDGKPVGIIIPIISAAHATIVIDGIRLIGGAGYPAPRPFALRVIGYTQCAGAWPLRRTERGLVLDGCGVPDLGPLIGHRVHWSGTLAQSEAVAEVGPPRPRNCWVLTHVGVRYHVGTQRFSAIYPDAMVTCTDVALPIVHDVMWDAAKAARG